MCLQFLVASIFGMPSKKGCVVTMQLKLVNEFLSR